MKIQPLSAGLTCGVMLCLINFFITVLCVSTGGYTYGYGLKYLSLWVDINPGYNISYTGAFIGLHYWLIEGFLVGYIISILYNITSKIIPPYNNN